MGAPRYPAPEGFKVCCTCLVTKPVSEFHAKSKRDPSPMSYCIPCRKAARKALEGRPDDPVKLAARFWSKVDKRGPDECWNWLAGKHDRGYGHFYFRGDNWRAHRVSLILAGTEVPRYDGGSSGGLVVDHACGNTGCVNPAHLRVVTQGDNCGPLARDTPHWVNKHKTECKRHHPFTPENIMPSKRGHRNCRACYDMRRRGEIK